MRQFLILVVVLAAACKTTAPADGGASDRRLFGDEPLTAEWKDWTPEQTRSTPAVLHETMTAFDYWQVTDEVQREEAWSAMFGLLSEVRRVAPRDYDKTFRMLMTVLEPQMADGASRLDTTFFAARPGQGPMFEGVAWRLWRELPSGAAPGVTVFLRRYEASMDQPIEAFVWFYAGFEESPSLTLRLDGEKNWSMTLASGIGMSPSTPAPGEAMLLRGILQQTFWRPVVGAQYLETTIARRDETTATPDQQPVALGLALGDRDIDQVFTDSVFAPRLTLFPAKQ